MLIFIFTSAVWCANKNLWISLKKTNEWYSQIVLYTDLDLYNIDLSSKTKKMNSKTKPNLIHFESSLSSHHIHINNSSLKNVNEVIIYDVRITYYRIVFFFVKQIKIYLTHNEKKKNLIKKRNVDASQFLTNYLDVLS